MTEPLLQIDCTYMTDGVTMPFCKGCGHTHVLNKLNDALEQLCIPPKDVCLVTDIGCIGLADALFDKVHTVHTTHGRSTAFATGIVLADKVLAEKKLKTIVLIGDGGSMIGLLHIVNAALLNTDVTVIVANNFLFGMTGGQQSSFTPLDFITQTTPIGNIIPPLDLCEVIKGAKAEFIARKISTDKDLVQTIADAITHNGFSLVEIMELCTEHAVEKNELKGNALAGIAQEQEQQLGMIKNETQRKEFGDVYIEKYFTTPETKKREEQFIIPQSLHTLEKKLGIIISGSAGEKVQSAAAMFCEAALNAGLYTTQKNDNPVTQGSGFSLSELIVSPNEIYYTGVDVPSVVIIVSNEGLKEVKSQKVFERVNEETLLILDETILPIDSVAKQIRLPFRKINGGSKAALAAIDYVVSTTQPFPPEILHNLIQKKFGDYDKFFNEKHARLLQTV